MPQTFEKKNPNELTALVYNKLLEMVPNDKKNASNRIFLTPN